MGAICFCVAKKSQGGELSLLQPLPFRLSGKGWQWDCSGQGFVPRPGAGGLRGFNSEGIWPWEELGRHEPLGGAGDASASRGASVSPLHGLCLWAAAPRGRVHGGVSRACSGSWGAPNARETVCVWWWGALAFYFGEDGGASRGEGAACVSVRGPYKARLRDEGPRGQAQGGPYTTGLKSQAGGAGGGDARAAV